MRRMKMILVMCLAAGLSGAASAATWTGLGGNSNWSNADNWDTGVVPGQHEPVNIDGSAAVNFDSGNIERSANTNLTGSAKLTAANRRFLHGANAACTFTIADEAQLVHSGDYFIVSQRQPSTINQTGGTVTATINRGFFMTDNGSAAGSRYNLTGGALNVQFVAQGDDWFNEFLGRGGAQGTFYVDGGQANISVNPAALTRHIYIKNGSVLQVDSGSASFSGFRWFSIGRSDSGEAKVIVNGGVLNITSRSDGAVIVGGENSEGRIEVSGGRLNIAGPNGLWIADGAGSKRGIVEQTGGDITVDSDVVLGRAGTAEGTYYKMDGGTLTARDLYLGENAHASVQFIFNAGVITLGGDRTSLVEEAWFHAAPGTLVEYDSVNDVTVISLIPHAHNPLPAHGAVDVPVDVTLSWKTGLSVDPNDNPGQPNATISKHLLYMSSGNAGDTSLYFIAEIPAGDPVGATGSYGPLSLELDKTYAWRVDEVAEPNIFTGPVWSFSTPHATPVQVGISPAKSLVDTGTPIAITNTYTSIASSVTGVTWYLNDVAIDPQTDSNISVVFNATQSTLSIASVSDAYTGQYTCVVRNEGGDSAPSAPAAVALKKLLAWYPFEQNAVDAAGHNSGTLMGGELAYASGSVASGGQAYAADPNGSNYLVLTADSYPKAGFGNGLDSFTVSFWLLEGSNTGDDIYVLGSLNDGNRTGFEFGVNSGGNLKCHYRDEDGNGSLTQSGGLSLRDGQWHYLVVTRSGDTLTVYADGEAKASSSVGAIDNFAAWDHPFTILADNLRGTITKHVTGMVDDLRIYNYGLTSEEIAVAYYDETGTSACLDAPDTRYNLVNTGSSYCRVDLTDFAEFALNWLDCGLYPDCL